MEKIIDQKTAQDLKEKFLNELNLPVDVKVFTNSIITPDNQEVLEYNFFAKQFIKELAAIDPRILYQELSISDKIVKEFNIQTSPSIVVGYDLGYKIIFNGAPSGYEANSLIETITLVSSQKSSLSDSTKKYLNTIKEPVSIKVFVTPSCPYCPNAVILANKIAIEKKGLITSECIEASENQNLAAEFGVSSVPHTFINNDINKGLIGFTGEKNFIDFLVKNISNADFNNLKKEEEQMKEQKEKLVDNPSEAVYLSEKNFEQALKKYPNLIIDCWAEWCMPCRMLSPIIDELAKENQGKVVFAKLNVDENPDISSKYGIMSIPTLLFFKNGKKINEIVGARPKIELQKLIDKTF